MNPTSKTHEHFMRAALIEAKRSTDEGNQGVGAVIVRNGQITANGRNLQNSTKDPTTHAEMVAIQNFAKTQHNTDLSGTAMYTTFEPCPMCCGAILASGITTLVMGGRPGKQLTQWGNYTPESLFELTGKEKDIAVVIDILVEECMAVRP